MEDSLGPGPEHGGVSEPQRLEPTQTYHLYAENPCKHDIIV